MSSACKTGCGFFGSPLTQNFCSMCFLEYFNLVNERSPLARIKVITSNKSIPRCDSDRLVFPTGEFNLGHFSDREVSDSSNDHKTESCECFCDKNIGFLEFRCRCGGRFCGVHQFPEDHECRYDYKNAERDDCLKLNRICKADKLKTRV